MTSKELEELGGVLDGLVKGREIKLLALEEEAVELGVSSEEQRGKVGAQLCGLRWLRDEILAWAKSADGR